MYLATAKSDATATQSRIPQEEIQAGCFMMIIVPVNYTFFFEISLKTSPVPTLFQVLGGGGGGEHYQY